MPRRRGNAATSCVRAALVVCAVFGASGCKGLFSPSPAPLWRTLVPEWSPYVVVGPNDDALPGYREAFASLSNRGAIQGVRIGLSANGSSGPTVNLAASFGIDIVGIVDNSELFGTDVEGAFDRYRAAYPQVRTFQIGNEITTLQGTRMTIDQYVEVFARVYARVASTYPDVTLVSQATFGSGTIGSADLRGEADGFRLRGLSRVVLGVNVYTETALTAYAVVAADIARDYPIWVTETGIPDPAKQLPYVTVTYPVLRTALHADRIYWYALWAGDVGGDSDFSLIKSPIHPPIVTGPLFQVLAQ